MRLMFGYNAGLPESAEAAWGARAIVTQDGSIDVVWDRTDACGPDEPRAALLERLRELNPPWRERASKLLRTGQMDTRTGGEFTLYEDEGIAIKANTNGSAGYLYVVAYATEKEEAQ